MYDISFKAELDKTFAKLSKKNPKQLEIIFKKISEISFNPHRYKHLRSPKQHLKRVHIDKHFVLIFSINETEKTIVLEDYDHHDNIYK
jgi:YafQ family addiction module toxin component